MNLPAVIEEVFGLALLHVLGAGGGCGPVVRLLACHARAWHSIPCWRESGVFKLMWRHPSGHGITTHRVLQ